jgi:hypothetical protein
MNINQLGQLGGPNAWVVCAIAIPVTAIFAIIIFRNELREKYYVFRDRKKEKSGPFEKMIKSI